MIHYEHKFTQVFYLVDPEYIHHMISYDSQKWYEPFCCFTSIYKHIWWVEHEIKFEMQERRIIITHPSKILILSNRYFLPIQCYLHFEITVKVQRSMFKWKHCTWIVTISKYEKYDNYCIGFIFDLYEIAYISN